MFTPNVSVSIDALESVWNPFSFVSASFIVDVWCEWYRYESMQFFQRVNTIVNANAAADARCEHGLKRRHLSSYDKQDNYSPGSLHLHKGHIQEVHKYIISKVKTILVHVRKVGISVGL